ncbi:outer dynein arm-docking complex subunit 4-like [Tubulanus polymorphus]|uniref:outer dynein arm-docking complex subunit 4-like n=1 Tax=Tubulanus polymorphus TaxID=672921 RepID=UPI003DA3D8D0
MNYGEEDENGPVGTFESYRAEADILAKQGDHRKAADSYTTALDIEAGDRYCLVARSRCWLNLGDTKQALEDAEASLREDKGFDKGLYQKAEVLYHMGDFEHALVFYHRGYKLRPEQDEFRLGIQKAREAIENSCGSPNKVKLTKDGDLSFFKDDARTKSTRTVDRPGMTRFGRSAGHPMRQSTGRPLKKTPSRVKKERTIKQLLGELYSDKVYLEKLLDETESQQGTRGEIQELVCDGLNYLTQRADLWRQQKPMYARRNERLAQRKKYSTKTSLNQYVNKQFEKITTAQNKGNYLEALKRAKLCLTTVTNWDERTFPNLDQIVANCHCFLGNAYLEMGHHQRALRHYKVDYKISQEKQLSEDKSRALDNLGRVYARLGDFERAVHYWSQTLSLARTPTERSWLYHEIGRSYLEIGKTKEALDYGNRSLDAAAEVKDNVWASNASVLIAQSQVKTGDFESALASFNRAYELAQDDGDEEALDALQKAIDEISSRITKKPTS